MPACIRWIYNCTSRAGWTAMFLLAAFFPLSHAEETSFGNTYSTSWVGNTHNEGNSLWMPDWQRSLGVSPDGTVFVAGGSEVDGAAMVRWDAVAGKARIIGRFGSHWDWSWCAAVDTNGWYVGGEKKGLVRFPLAPLDPDVPTPQPEVRLIEQGWISGVAVIGDEVFAMDATLGKLRVFNTKTLKEVRSWDVPKDAVQLAADDRGRLWTVVGALKSKTGVVRSWNADGTDTGLQLEGLDEALTVAWDGFAKRLLIGTGGSTNQILIVDVEGAKPKVVDTFGVKGGVMSEPAGKMGPGRFKRIRGLGVDAKGNRYVNCEYGWNGSNVDCYSPEGKRLWFVYNNGFCEGIVLDPQDETIAYSSRQRFTMDWSKKTPGSEATWDAITWDGERFPNEGRSERFTQPIDLLHIGGKPILTYTFQGGGCLWASRFEDTFAVPSAFLGTICNNWGADEGAPLGFPKENGPDAWQQLMWLDRNGDGFSEGQPEEFTTGAKPVSPGFYSFSADGSIWALGAEEWDPSKPPQIYKVPCEGLDEHGVPRWDFAKRISFPAPEGLGNFRTATFEEAKDRLYVQSIREGVHRLSRWDHFTGGKSTRIWESAPIPYEDAAHTPGLGYGGGMSKTIRQAGKYLFISYGWSSLVSVWDSEYGSYIGTLKPVGIPLNLDGALDADYGHSAFLRKDGEYAVFAESAGCGRVNLYRWKPHADIVGTNGIKARADAQAPAVDLTWGTVPGVEKWRVERLGGADAEWLQIAELPAKTLKHRDNGLWAGTIYQYRIRAVKRAYVSDPTVPALVGTTDPSALTGTPIGSGKATAGAFDGDLRTVAVDDEKDPRPGWVGLDFGKPVAVTRAYVLAPDDFQGDTALSDARLQVAAAPEGPWTDAGLQLGDLASGSLARRSWTEQTLSGKYRCVRLLGSKDRPLRLAELRVSAASKPVTKLVVPNEILAVDPGQEIELAAEATGNIARVDFVVDGRCIGSAKKAPFRLRWRVPADKGSWTVRAAAMTKQGQASWSESAIVHTRGAAILRLNSKGDKIPGWSVDGPPILDSGGDTRTDKPIDLSQAVDPAPEAVYQTCQWDPREIRIDQLVPGRRYVVRLHLAEILTHDLGKGPNTRRSKVLVGYDWKLNLDVFAQAGGDHRALTRSFLATADRQGTILIVMQWLNESGQAQPCLNGIELIDPLAAEGKP